MVVSPSPKHRSDKGYRHQGYRNSPGSLAMLAVTLRASSFVSSLAADRRPRRAPEAISAVPKSWEPSPRHGGSLYCLVGHSPVQELAFVSLIKLNRSSRAPIPRQPKAAEPTAAAAKDSEDNPEYEAFEHLRANFNYLI